MKTLFLFLSLLAVQTSFAQVQFNPTRQILMTGKTCEELNQHAQSILDWKNLTSDQELSLPECFCSSKSCQMDVAEISPYFVKELTNYESGFATSSAYSGPNCFNAALKSSGSLPHINFTHPYEMTAMLNSSLCTERKWDEPLVPGDILVVRDQSDPLFEIHAGVYIEGILSFSKYGQNSMMPYSYGFSVHRSYGVHDESCARLEGIPKPGEPCYNKPFVNYYRCDALYTFISKLVNQPTGLSKSAQQIYAAVSTYDLRISDVAFKGGKITQDKLTEYQSALQEIYAKTEVVGADTSLNKDNLELVRLMRFHTFSLYEQTRIIAKAASLKGTEPVLQAPKL